MGYLEQNMHLPNVRLQGMADCHAQGDTEKSAGIHHFRGRSLLSIPTCVHHRA